MTRKTGKTTSLAFSVLSGLIVAGSAVAEETKHLPADQLNWSNVGLPGIDYALLWGSLNDGASGRLVRIEAGLSVPIHNHTLGYHGVTIQGIWRRNSSEAGKADLPPGSYVHQAGGDPHSDQCVGPEDCILFVNHLGPWDYVPAN